MPDILKAFDDALAQATEEAAKAEAECERLRAELEAVEQALTEAWPYCERLARLLVYLDFHVRGVPPRDRAAAKEVK